MYAHAQALRKGRTSVVNHFYSVTVITYQRHKYFLDFDNARKVIAALKNSDELGFTQTISFIVMPDHFHWLFQLKNKENLSEVLRRVKGCSSFNIKNKHTPQVWQQGFYDSLIRNEDHLIAQARYIVATPLRASLVKYIGDYPFWDCIYLK
ncbi:MULTISPECIES: REP-associated tyrosine transposase [Pseudoalteromonas]|uniref:REP-associated tyrosine transposase n=1 Tax=Pseudoalteromonas TaxID=53246 RepID=UPI0002ED8470|nr:MULTISPECIES: transposase [Pseudoalteromonas]MCF6145974.1 hypothetical protein [Pseudoalteromonas mariniglutinosa NCIMB 1770]